MTAFDSAFRNGHSDRADLLAVQGSRIVNDAREIRSICVAIAWHVGVVFEVPVFRLFASSRGGSRASFARQVAMYIAHVEFGLSQRQVGDGFGRDRTTVAYACRKIEDCRDCSEFEKSLGQASQAAWGELHSYREEFAASDLTSGAHDAVRS